MAGKSLYRNCQIDICDNDILYLIGVYFGDGWIVKKKNRFYEFGFGTMDLDFLERVLNIVKKIRGKKPNVLTIKKKNRKDFYCIYFGFKIFCEWLYKESDNKKQIPKYIKNLNKNKIKYFLAGYFDSDGYVSQRKYNGKTLKSKNMYFTSGFSTVSPWYKDMINLFQKAGVKIGTSKTRKSFFNNKEHQDRTDVTLYIESLAKAKLPLSVSRKRKKLEEYLSTLSSTSIRETP